METFLIESKNPEDSKAIKEFLKSLNINYKSSSSISLEVLERANGIAEVFIEAKKIESGEKEAKSYSSFKELMDEL
ncbi:hypothetical protein SAMN03080617_02719 [Algoriphagus alkaliphilus]|uniref:Uncharacterized protein n=1 Tax=Algoriphagus alkaliphilus TaxID=279824 RepID=A0A1G5YPZ1_9BACT|nr:hypothetical protein [Algoriphagus alkaliphilus]MBA4299547.1 hypothetical protein [Cyclobacterium sp.]SDA84506.1 hypothetical protein SAMN03080617_02719 [Algoriphagus alkaliphilus]